MASDPKLHTFDEVAKHNKTEDCWLIISGKVRSFFSFYLISVFGLSIQNCLIAFAILNYDFLVYDYFCDEPWV